MSDRVLVPLPDGRWLALTPETFRQGLADAAAFGPAPIAAGAAGEPEPPLLDAEQLAEAMGVAVTWVEQAARDGRIPSVHAGRWRRFNRAAVEAVLAANGKGRSA